MPRLRQALSATWGVLSTRGNTPTLTRAAVFAREIEDLAAGMKQRIASGSRAIGHRVRLDRYTEIRILICEVKPVRWVGSSRRDLKAFPKAVRRDIGQALYAAQRGEEYPSVKALRGFGGRSVLEIVAPYQTDAYRAVYTVRFHDAIYVLHAFQKKSTHGIATSQQDLDLIRQRLAVTERDYRERQGGDEQDQP